MFGLFRRSKISVEDAQNVLTAFVVEDALRGAAQFRELLVELTGDVPPAVHVRIDLEFLVVSVHFLEREFERSGLQQYFEPFIQPIRLLALCRFAELRAPGQTDSKPYLDIWDSALDAYYPQQDFYRPPLTPFAKQSVSGQFGNRVAAILGEPDFSLAAATASQVLGVKVAAHAKSKVLQKTFEAVKWQ